MRKPDNREKFKAALAALIAFYGRRDMGMVAEVLREKAQALAATRSPEEAGKMDAACENE
jgi:hypothetical protein